jgi:ribosome recycling factor
MSINAKLIPCEQKMQSTLQSLTQDLSSIRTGRAHVSMLDLIRAEVYGQKMPLNQLATISTPESQLVTVQVWDANNVKFVEKAIRESDLNVNPSVDGQIVRVPVPKLSEERRKELIKIVKNQSEKIKISIRNIRREGMDSLKEFLKNKEITEDDNKKISDELQKITDKFIQEVDKKITDKEQEILKV